MRNFSNQTFVRTICTFFSLFAYTTQTSLFSAHKASYTRACRMVREPLANQMRVCVDGTANLHCAVCEQFAYCSLQTEICLFFAQTQRELNAPGVLCSLQVWGKLINCAPLTRCLRTAQRISGTLVYTKFKPSATPFQLYK